MTLRVAHIAPIFSTVPPTGYGGVERVVEELTATQLEECAGLDVMVMASSDSNPTAPAVGRFASIRSRHAIDLAESFAELDRHYAWALDEAFAADVDVVHLHGPWGLPHIARCPAQPTVVSIYDDTRRPDVTDPLLTLPESVFLVANSRSTRDKAPFVPWHDVVLEGLRVDQYPFAAEKEPYCCFVGELVPDKGLDIAVRVARSAGLELRVIGRPRMLDVDQALVDDQLRYLDRELYPHLGRGVEFLGELGEDRLAIIARAQALLAPARAEEPFGRVCAESMACGTPVIMFDRGSAPEIIADGRSGFIVDSVEAMITALRATTSLSPVACRRHAQDELGMGRVASRYAQIYAAAAAWPTKTEGTSR